MRPFASAALLLVGATIGVLSTIVLHWQPSRQDARGEPAESLVQLQREVASLSQAIDQLRMGLNANVQSPQAVRIEDSPAPEVQTALARIEERLASLSTRVDEGIENRLFTEPPGAKAQDLTATALLRDAVANANQDVAKRHFCWSPQHVYGVYGMPNSVVRSGQAIRWIYYPDSSDQGVELTFEDGVVTRIGAYQSPNPRR